jgi:outer membrane protein assembly factor BamE
MRKVILLLIVLTGCRQVPMLPGLSAHRIDIQQGNYVTQDMVAKLKPGMTKSQVRFALGTPLIVDPFHADRWDYIYMMQKAGRTVEQRRIVVVFDSDKLLRIDGDVVPGAASPGSATSSEVKSPLPGSVPDSERVTGVPTVPVDSGATTDATAGPGKAP